MKTIKMCGVLLHFPYDPYPQQLNVSQVMMRAFTRLQNGAVEIPTGCGKTMALVCSAMGFQVEQRYKLMEVMSNDDSIWETSTPKNDSRFESTSGAGDASEPISFCISPGSPNYETPCCSPFPTASPAHSAFAVSKSVYALSDDDSDDFVVLPRRRSTPMLKKPRRDCGEGSCCFAPCGSAGDAGPGRNCVGRPGSGCLVDIEDGRVAPPMRPLAERETEVIDLASSSSTSEDSRDEDCAEAAPLASQEVLSRSFLSGECGGGVGVEGEDESDDADADADTPWTLSITREVLRAALKGRSRHPNPKGEFGPTRRLVPPRSRALIRVPKIFYASRTHLQLEQVASEIKNTNYCDARVVVLSSREFTCVNDNAFRGGRYANRTEMCRELLNDVPDEDLSDAQNMMHLDQSSPKSSCYFFRNSKQYATHDAMENINVGPVVDINCLVKAGRTHKFCPYFSARNLISTADIVLCPVNYLVDPLIRKSMDIELKGEIVIFDEAHMLEDVCREAASMIIPISNLKECLENCNTLVDRGQLPSSHRALGSFLEALTIWIETNSKKSVSYGFNKEKEFSLSSTYLLASFEQLNINEELLSKFEEGLSEASRHKMNILTRESKTSANYKVISNKTENICERLALIMNFVFKYPEDYVGSVTFSSKFNSDASFRSPKEQEWSIKLVCQNSGLVFQMLSSVTRSIIFSSATLSPIPAFAAELGVQIQNFVVRGHVIPANQTWIGCLGRGKNGLELYGRYNNTKSVEYMDEIGNIVLDICLRVPYGILVFVTAYWTLENITQRWRDTGLWAKIAEHKSPFSETRRAKDFNEVLRCFYSSVEKARQGLESGCVTIGNGCTGPLLVAVMRGKVSEGFNFADDKTRAIISVGIPYPNIHEDSIRWKREYNKCHAIKRPLQDAEGWYNTQAFRALSQSLGRGLRHRNDWCLLLLIDSRLQQTKYSRSLPQWMGERMVNHFQYPQMLMKIEDYIKRMKTV